MERPWPSWQIMRTGSRNSPILDGVCLILTEGEKAGMRPNSQGWSLTAAKRTGCTSNVALQHPPKTSSDRTVISVDSRTTGSPSSNWIYMKFTDWKTTYTLSKTDRLEVSSTCIILNRMKIILFSIPKRTKNTAFWNMLSWNRKWNHVDGKQFCFLVLKQRFCSHLFWLQHPRHTWEVGLSVTPLHSFRARYGWGLCN